jgi:hypothetical protein
MTGRLGASADGSSTLPDSINLIKKALAKQVPFLYHRKMMSKVKAALRAAFTFGVIAQSTDLLCYLEQYCHHLEEKVGFLYIVDFH